MRLVPSSTCLHVWCPMAHVCSSPAPPGTCMCMHGTPLAYECACTAPSDTCVAGCREHVAPMMAPEHPLCHTRTHLGAGAGLSRSSPAQWVRWHEHAPAHRCVHTRVRVRRAHTAAHTHECTCCTPPPTPTSQQGSSPGVLDQSCCPSSPSSNCWLNAAEPGDHQPPEQAPSCPSLSCSYTSTEPQGMGCPGSPPGCPLSCCPPELS